MDGFRFDLATVLGREGNGFNEHSASLQVAARRTLARLRQADRGALGRGLRAATSSGDFPPGWAEWNDRYRDTVRAFWRRDGGRIGEFAERFAGSSDLFRHNGRKPTAGINFLTAHDGFTLNDLVSYDERHNEANLREQCRRPSATT